jgi:spore cortex formation protein SpoVR/YcgB (stage V sporulation)
MMEDIKRICVEPTDEDRTWFPEIAGNGDWRGTLKHAWANYRDESFILQYLSPHLIRKLRLFLCVDEADKRHVKVENIHNEQGYKAVRTALARSYDLAIIEADVQVVSVDMGGDRRLCLQHLVRDGVHLSEKGRGKVIAYVRRLWGYDVDLVGVDKDTGEKLYESSTSGPAAAA